MAIDMAPFDRRQRPPGDAADRRPPGHAGAGALGLWPRRQRPLLAVRRRATTRRLPQREQDIEQAKSLLKTAGHGRPDGRPAHDRRRRGHGRLGQRLRLAGARQPASPSTSRTTRTTTATSTSSCRSRSTSGARAATCRRSASAASAPRPYNETHWPPKSGEARTTSASTSRRVGRDETDQALRHHPRDAEDRVQRGRVHHPVLQQPGRRLQRQGRRDSRPSKATLNLDTFGHGYRTIWFA